MIIPTELQSENFEDYIQSKGIVEFVVRSSLGDGESWGYILLIFRFSIWEHQRVINGFAFFYRSKKLKFFFMVGSLVVC